MEWWQYLVISVVSVSVGASLAYFFNKRGIKSEREATVERQSKNAIAAILREIKANESISKKPWTGKQLPFLLDNWTTYKWQLPELPEQTIQKIDEFYLDVILANAIVNKDLRLPHGSGYLDNDYKKMCKEIEEKSPQLITMLEPYLK